MCKKAGISNIASRSFFDTIQVFYVNYGACLLIIISFILVSCAPNFDKRGMDHSPQQESGLHTYEIVKEILEENKTTVDYDTLI